jgi:multisubunit Na+/H+ antiporter MnhB subunit
LPSKKELKAMAKSSRIARIRTLYAILLGVIALFITLFILNVVSAADPIGVMNLGDQSKDYGLIITDLQRPVQNGSQTTIEGLGDSLSASVRTNTYDVTFQSDNEQLLNSSKVYWCFGLQLFSVLAFFLMIILTVITLISFYINVRRGKVFPKKNIRWLTWVGILMITMSLSMDACTWIEQSLAATLLAGTEWEPTTSMPIHIGRIVFGVTIIFMAQIFYIGREMQEEQELTI